MRAPWFGLLLSALLCWWRPAQADDLLMTDLGSRVVAITSSFTGSSVLVFGSVIADGPGPRDVVVVLRGPEQSIRVREKNQRAGIWMNTEALAFGAVPALYAVAATRPLDKIATPSVLNRNQIGLDYLKFRPTAGPTGDLSTGDPGRFREALFRLKQASGLYQLKPVPVTLVGPSLFRAELDIPSSVPVGNYKVEVYLFRAGELVAVQSSSLFVDKIGLERWLYKLAQDYPALYGLTAVTVACFTGWLAAVIFRRKS